MKWTYIILVLTITLTKAQEVIPACIQEKIDVGKDLKGNSLRALYLVEVEREQLYYLTSYAKPTPAPTISYFIDENCEVKKTSSIGGIAGVKYAKKINILKTLWKSLPTVSKINLEVFLNKVKSFNVTEIPEDTVKLKLENNTKINISWKNGLKTFNKNGTALDTYKIIPKGKFIVDENLKLSKKATENNCNALLFLHDEEYWLLYANSNLDFILVKSDKYATIHNHIFFMFYVY